MSRCIFINKKFQFSKTNKEVSLSKIWSTKDILGNCFDGEHKKASCDSQKHVICGIPGRFERYFLNVN